MKKETNNSKNILQQKLDHIVGENAFSQQSLENEYYDSAILERSPLTGKYEEPSQAIDPTPNNNIQVVAENSIIPPKNTINLDIHPDEYWIDATPPPRKLKWLSAMIAILLLVAGLIGFAYIQHSSSPDAIFEKAPVLQQVSQENASPQATIANSNVQKQTKQANKKIKAPKQQNKQNNSAPQISDNQSPAAETEQGLSNENKPENTNPGNIDSIADNKSEMTTAPVITDSPESTVQNQQPGATSQTDPAPQTTTVTPSPKQAITTATQPEPQTPAAGADYSLLMKKAKKARNHKKRITLLKEATAINPTADEPAALLAIYMMEKKHTRNEALEHAQKAIKINPDNAMAWLAIGYVRQLTGSTKEAREAYQKCASCSGPKRYVRDCQLLL